MLSIKSKAFLRRFIKGFIAGGISSVLVFLNAGFVISDLTDLRNFGVALGISFLTGSLLAVEKMLTWEEAQLQTIGTTYESKLSPADGTRM